MGILSTHYIPINSVLTPLRFSIYKIKIYSLLKSDPWLDSISFVQHFYSVDLILDSYLPQYLVVMRLPYEILNGIDLKASVTLGKKPIIQRYDF